MGLPLDHKTVSNWHIKVCEYYLSSLYELLRKELLKLDVIHADETPYRVLDSERVKDYVWTFLSGKHTEKPIVLYNMDHEKEQKRGIFSQALADTFIVINILAIYD